MHDQDRKSDSPTRPRRSADNPRIYGPYAKRSTATSVGRRLRGLNWHLPTTYFRIWHPEWLAEVCLG